MTIRVLLVDDHKMFRDCVCALLAREPGLAVVGDASERGELLELVATTRPDVVCIGVNMARFDSIEVTRELLTLMPRIKVVGLSDNADWPVVRDLMKAGAHGFVSKSASPEELCRAIHSVVERATRYLCPQLAETVMGAALGDSTGPVAAGRLTLREQQVLACVARGMSSAEIARQLNIRLATVRGYRSNIMRNLDLHNRPELTRFAIVSGIVARSDPAYASAC